VRQGPPQLQVFASRLLRTPRVSPFELLPVIYQAFSFSLTGISPPFTVVSVVFFFLLLESILINIQGKGDAYDTGACVALLA